MATISSIFERVTVQNDGEILNMQIHKADRNIFLSVSFNNLVEYANIKKLEKTICIAYRLSKVKIKPKYEKILFSDAYFNNLMYYLLEEVPSVRGVLAGAYGKTEDNKLIVNIKNANVDLLMNENCNKVVENIIKEQFDINCNVEFCCDKNVDNSVEAHQEKAEQIIKNYVQENIPAQNGKPEVFYGRKINGYPTPIKDINIESGRIIIEGEVIDIEERETRTGNIIFRFDVTDYESSVSCKIINITKEAYKPLKENIKNGEYVAVKGEVNYDKYSRENVLLVSDVEPRECSKRSDNSEEKRVELHLHTQMSAMDGLTDIKTLVKRATQFGHKAVAITDHGVVQAFPFVAKAAKDTGLKIIYGVEGYLVNDGATVVTNSKNQILDENVVVFDIETTGFSPVNNKIIEIGAVKIKDGKIADRFSKFVNPQTKIPEKIVELTGITDSMVSDADIIDVVLPQFLEFCGDAVLVAHNASFDCSFIRANCSNLGYNFNFTTFDTLEMSRGLFKELKNHKLNTVAEYLNVSLVGHHRAVNDAEATANIFLKCCEKLREMKIETLDQINTAMSGSIDVKKKKYNHIIILAKNAVGLKNLYKLITYSHVETFFRKPRIPKSILLKHKEGLIIGSACEQGELYQAVLRNAPFDEIVKIAGLYDYFEIQPLGNNEYMLRNGTLKSKQDLIEINKKIINLAEKFNKFVVATGDVHFLDPQDAKFRAVLQGGQGFEDADNQAPLFYRTTEEMLDEFKYLGEEKAYEVVVTNTNKVADMIEEFPLLPKGLCPPQIDEAPDEIKRMSIEKATRIYGEKLPDIVKERMDKELNSIIKHGFSVMYYIAHKLVKKSNEDGYLVGSRGSVGSSFVAFLTDITEVNALPPHYVCPNCKNSEFIMDGSVACGVDMEDRNCPVCGTPYYKDGHDIPFETFLGFDGDKTPDIDLNFSGIYQQQAHKYTEVLFGEGYTYKAGTISALQDKTAYGFVKKYLDERNIVVSNAEINRLVRGCVGVKRTTGQHPGGIIIVPKGRDIHEFCPYQKPADKQDSDVNTTHFDFHSIDSNLLKLDLLGHDDPSMIRMLEDLTGVDAKTIRLDDKAVMSLFTGTSALGVTEEQINSKVGTFGIPEFGTAFVRQMLLDTKPTTFSELVRISGLSHGTDVWLNNAQDLIRNGEATLKEAICTRDDIMVYLIYRGLPSKSAFDIMEHVRRGKGLTPEEEELMKKYSVPDWYIRSCKAIKYMFPKAHAVAYVTMAFRIAYFKVHYPKEYYIAHFTIRADDFNYELMCGGYEQSVMRRKELEAQGNALSVKDKNILTILEMVCEMNARGINFLPIDLYKSDATKFLSVEDGILPPLLAIQGLGETVAETIVREREIRPFETKEDLRNRGKVSKTIVETMEKLGFLDGLPESNQISFFDL